jgi:hypothetical protein
LNRLGDIQMRKITVLSVLSALAALVFAAPASAHDFNCGYFASQLEAQNHYDSHGGADPDRLDGNDNDGIACEDNGAPYSDVWLAQHGGSSVGSGTDTGTSTDSGQATQLPATGTGGYLSGSALDLSPALLLAGAFVLGITLASGGMVFRRSLR